MWGIVLLTAPFLNDPKFKQTATPTFPTDLDTMHCKKHSWENQQELSPNKEQQ